MVLVITGNPGVGKHTAAKKIVSQHMPDLEILDINKVVLENKSVVMLNHPKRRRNYTQSNSNSHIISKKSDDYTIDVDTERLGYIISQKISAKSIVVGHLAPYVLKKDQIKLAVILRKNPNHLERIYKKRKYPLRKIRDNQASEILGVIAHDTIARFGPRKVAQVDTTNTTGIQTAYTINKILENFERYYMNHKGNKYMVTESVDWLALLKTKRDIKKFFPDDELCLR